MYDWRSFLCYITNKCYITNNYVIPEGQKDEKTDKKH